MNRGQVYKIMVYLCSKCLQQTQSFHDPLPYLRRFSSFTPVTAKSWTLLDRCFGFISDKRGTVLATGSSSGSRSLGWRCCLLGWSRTTLWWSNFCLLCSFVDLYIVETAVNNRIRSPSTVLVLNTANKLLETQRNKNEGLYLEFVQG